MKILIVLGLVIGLALSIDISPNEVTISMEQKRYIDLRQITDYTIVGQEIYPSDFKHINKFDSKKSPDFYVKIAEKIKFNQRKRVEKQQVTVKTPKETHKQIQFHIENNQITIKNIYQYSVTNQIIYPKTIQKEKSQPSQKNKNEKKSINNDGKQIKWKLNKVSDLPNIPSVGLNLEEYAQKLINSSLGKKDSGKQQNALKTMKNHKQNNEKKTEEIKILDKNGIMGVKKEEKRWTVFVLLILLIIVILVLAKSKKMRSNERWEKIKTKVYEYGEKDVEEDYLGSS